VKGSEPVSACLPAGQNEGCRIQLLDDRRAADQCASAQLRSLKDRRGNLVTAMPEWSRMLPHRLAGSRLRQFDGWHLANNTEPGGRGLNRHREVAKPVKAFVLGMEKVAYVLG
jgi:hypothetical protein